MSNAGSCPDNSSCLFCTNPTVGKGYASLEHLIPDSMAGPLTTHDVCKPCNDCFGAELDSVAEDDLFIRLRCEAGLVPRHRVVGDYYDEYLGTTQRAYLGSDNTVDPMRKTQRSRVGNTVVISGASRREVEREVKRESERIKSEGLEFAPEPIQEIHERSVRFQTVGSGSTIEKLRAKLGREAAKIAIELISLRASSEVARHPALQLVRDYARYGTPLDGVEVKRLGPNALWLPRTSILLRGGESSTPSEGEVLQLPQTDIPRTCPPGATPLTDIVHELNLYRDKASGHFLLLLFGAVLVHIPLPGDLPLPWGLIETYDIMLKRSWIRRVSN